jgi:hypothetical protein
VEPPEVLNTIDQLPVGSRLLYRAKKDWRMAAVAAVRNEHVVLTVCSASGRTYRLRRQADTEIVFAGDIPLVKQEKSEDWRENFSSYDSRW